MKLRLEEGLPVSLLSKEAGVSKRRNLSLGEGVSGAGRSGVKESGSVVGESEEASRSGAREDCRDQEAESHSLESSGYPIY